MAFVIDRSLYLSPEVVGEPGLRPLKEVDPFSLEALVAWLEKQPRSRKYVWPDCFACLMHHYYTDALHGALDGEFPAAMAFDIGCHFERPFGSINAYHEVGGSLPWTMGGALDRARKLLAEREK